MSVLTVANGMPPGREAVNPTGMYGLVMLVTPAMAAAWLLTMIPNRNLRKTRVKAYCRSRVGGKWGLTHQGIAFDTQGRLFDGQHRLQMIVETGLATVLFVVHNVPDDALLHTDEQLPRSMRDAIKLAKKGDFSCSIIATANVLTTLPDIAETKRTQCRDDIIEILQTHPIKLAFSEEHLGGVFAATRVVRALVARAHPHVNTRRLEEFCRILDDGMAVSEKGGDDQAAIVYRNFLVKNKGSHGTLEQERYFKGQTALDCFLQRKPIKKVYGTHGDMFPLVPDGDDMV